MMKELHSQLGGGCSQMYNPKPTTRKTKATKQEKYVEATGLIKKINSKILIVIRNKQLTSTVNLQHPVIYI